MHCGGGCLPNVRIPTSLTSRDVEPCGNHIIVIAATAIPLRVRLPPSHRREHGARPLPIVPESWINKIRRPPPRQRQRWLSEAGPQGLLPVLRTSVEARTLPRQPPCAPTYGSAGHRIPGRHARTERLLSVGTYQKKPYLLFPRALPRFEIAFDPLFKLFCPHRRMPQIIREAVGFGIVTGQNTCLVRGCLLYTSPSPRDLSTSRMPSSA